MSVGTYTVVFSHPFVNIMVKRDEEGEPRLAVKVIEVESEQEREELGFPVTRHLYYFIKGENAFESRDIFVVEWKFIVDGEEKVSLSEVANAALYALYHLSETANEELGKLLQGYRDDIVSSARTNDIPLLPNSVHISVFFHSTYPMVGGVSTVDFLSDREVVVRVAGAVEVEFRCRGKVDDISRIVSWGRKLLTERIHPRIRETVRRFMLKYFSDHWENVERSFEKVFTEGRSPKKVKFKTSSLSVYFVHEVPPMTVSSNVREISNVLPATDWESLPLPEEFIEKFLSEVKRRANNDYELISYIVMTLFFLGAPSNVISGLTYIQRLLEEGR